MKIAYASDLHMEFGYPFSVEGSEDADIMILAGDVETDAMHWSKFLQRVSLSFDHKPIIVVLGNHEYYQGVYPDDLQKYKKSLDIAGLSNVHLLERESIIIDGIRFVGATLWTDFAKGKQKLACEKGMAFSYEIKESNGKNLSATRIEIDHQNTVAWLEDEFAHHCKEPTIVVTHHAPSFRSNHPFFAGSPIVGGFCSDMDHLIEKWKPVVWIHGHVHDPMQYQIGKTWILCNPWGHPKEGNEKKFNVFEIDKESGKIS